MAWCFDGCGFSGPVEPIVWVFLVLAVLLTVVAWTVLLRAFLRGGRAHAE